MGDQVRINGDVPSWADVYMRLDGERYYGVTEVTYKDSRNRVNVYGMGRAQAPRGKTSGKYEVDVVALKMDKPAVKAFRAALAAKASDKKSFGSVRFQAVVQYVTADGSHSQTDTIHNCTWQSGATSNTESGDPLMDAVEIHCTHIDYDGLTLYDGTEVTP